MQTPFSCNGIYRKRLLNIWLRALLSSPTCFRRRLRQHTMTPFSTRSPRCDTKHLSIMECNIVENPEAAYGIDLYTPNIDRAYCCMINKNPRRYRAHLLSLYKMHAEEKG